MAKVTKEIEEYIKSNYFKGLEALSKELNLDCKTIYRYGLKWGLSKIKPKSKWVELECPICQKAFQRTQNYITCAQKRGRSKFSCSKECAARKKETDGLMEKAYQLALSGKNNKEIAILINKPIGTVHNYLNKKKYRRIWGKGTSGLAIKRRLKIIYKNCLVCGFDRALEIAHIIPACQGGDLSEQNTMGLCPNHHHLFDFKKLTLEEAEKLKEKVPSYIDFIKKEE